MASNRQLVAAGALYDYGYTVLKKQPFDREYVEHQVHQKLLALIPNLSYSTVQSAFLALSRSGVFKKVPNSSTYHVPGSYNLPQVALEIDRHRTRKTMIQYVNGTKGKLV